MRYIGYIVILIVTLLCCTSCGTRPKITSPFEETNHVENIGIVAITAAGSITSSQAEIVYNAMMTYSHEVIKKKKLSINLIERLDLSTLLDEFKFQNEGITDPENLVEFGKINNLQKLILPTFVYDKGSDNFYISLKLVDLKTGRTIAMSHDMMEHYGIDRAVQLIVRHAVYELYGYGYEIGFGEKLKRSGWF